MITIGSVNIIAVLVASVVGFGLGMFWYSPAGFGKQWMKLVGMTKKDMEKVKKQGMAKEMSLGFLTVLIMSYITAWFMSLTDVQTIGEGITLVLTLWVGYIGTVTLGNVLWEKKPFELYVLNNAYTLVQLILISIVLVLM